MGRLEDLEARVERLEKRLGIVEDVTNKNVEVFNEHGHEGDVRASDGEYRSRSHVVTGPPGTAYSFGSMQTSCMKCIERALDEEDARKRYNQGVVDGLLCEPKAFDHGHYAQGYDDGQRMGPEPEKPAEPVTKPKKAERWRRVTSGHYTHNKGTVKRVKDTWYIYNTAGDEVGSESSATKAKRRAERTL